MQTARADSEQGPRLAVGAPVRHTLVSCGTNSAQALTCIQSVSVIPKAGDKAIAGKLTGNKVPSGFDGRIGDSERPISGAALTPAELANLKSKITPGFYEQWSFQSGSTDSVATSPIVVIIDFQPYLATWCWSVTSCSSNREEYTLALTSSLGPDTWKDNKDISFVVTIRAPKTFAFGEVSGSARNTTVKYGKDLPDFNGVAMREIIATISPIATARSNQAAGSLPDEKAYGYTYNANINIFGMNNDITQFLGPCGKMGGIQVLSHAMHSVDPVWDPVTETIKVRLVTPHFAPDGGLNIGYLELRIPRESALCMWKLDLDGSINASVSITYEDGSASSVATVIGKKIENDYLIITSGFHFSSPSVAIKIVKGTQTATPEPAISPVAAIAKKVTITCIKGKTSKKVTALKPTCPAGFKKK